jgi:hypothetical protein
MRINERVCDICGARMWNMDLQFWVKSRVKYGFPALCMKNYDICDKCFAELQVLIKERTKQKEPPKEET